MADQVRLYKRELKEAREQVATLSYNLESLVKAAKVRKARGVERARVSRETIARLSGVAEQNASKAARWAEAHARAEEVAQSYALLARYSEERRLELLALAEELGCDCVQHKMLEAVSLLKERAESLASGLLEEKKAKAKFFSDVAALLGCDCVPHKMLEAVKALQVAASAEGNDCIRVRLPRNGETHISIDGETWYEQKTGRKV